MARIAGLFPGQGSQTVGMGAEFLKTAEIARSLFEEADRVLGYRISDLCLSGPIERLTLTENAQPAILLVSCICYRVSGIELACAAGHSLGEYTALVAAGCLDFADALPLVHKRGRYMQEAVPPGQGKMVAVMGPTAEEIQAVIDKLEQGVVEIANLNSPGQTVVAGETGAVAAFCAAMSAVGGKIIPLNVSAPFHCRLMQPAAEKLSKDLDAIGFRDPRFPVYANFTAGPVTTGEQAKEALKKQVCGSVRWTQSMLAMVQEQQVTHTVEFGAGGVLSKLMKRIHSQTTRLEAADPASLEKTRQALADS
jgi:[acyl-carrier-protein] S-malonyltransferase